METKKNDQVALAPLRHFILPCPFCGGKKVDWMKWCECRFGVMHNANQQDPSRVVFNIECECGASGPIVRPSFVESNCRDDSCPTNADWESAAQTAWEAWNIRHPSPLSSKKYGLGCPFCGGVTGLTQYAQVICSNCGAQGPEPTEVEGRAEPDKAEEASGRKLWVKRVKAPSEICLGWGAPPQEEWEKYQWPPKEKKP